MVVLDNLPAHKVARLAKLVDAHGARLLYLLPYSPGFNPIKLVFSKLKIGLRTALANVNAVRTQTTGGPFGVYAALSAYSGSTAVANFLLEIYRQRSIELFLSSQRLEDSRRFGRPGPPTSTARAHPQLLLLSAPGAAQQP